MGIGAIGQYGGLYGNYRAQDIKTVDIETVRRQDEEKLLKENGQIPDAAGTKERQEQQMPPESPKQAGKITDLEDISLTFRKNDDFGYIGQDASLQSLDVQKAMSDMKKDQVLEQYQYFIGSAQDIISSGGMSTEDGSVILK